MNNITFDPSLNRRETPAMSPVGVSKIDPDKQVLTLTPRDSAPLARSMEEMWNDPHYAALYTNEGWFRRYTQQVGFEEINGLPEFPEMAKGMLNRAFLSDVCGVSPAEIDDAYPFYQGAFAQSVLGRPVTSERDFAQGVQDKFDESTSPAVEIAARIGRGGIVGVHETRAGFYAMINSLVRGQRNPYLDKTVEEARRDVPRLRREIAEAEEYIKLRQKSQRRGFVPPAGSPAARIGDLRHQLSLAELAAKGQTPENILGSLSRASEDLTKENVERQKAAESLFDEQISTAHDDQWAMRVADGIGQSAAGTATTMLDPVLGMSLVYSQTFQASRAEYQAVARERGLDPSEEAADRYAHEQTMVQMPFELVGDVVMAKTLKGIFRNVPAKISKAGPETFGHWIGEKAKDAAKSTAGEVLITTPSQTLAESLLAEGMGVRDETTWGEKGLSMLDAMSIAVGQSVGTNAGSIAIGGGIKTMKGDFDGRTPKPNTVDEMPPKGGKFDPEVRPGGEIEINPENAIKFSKAERPHRLAKPRESTYDNKNERFRDPAFVLQDFLRGVQSAGTSQRGKHGRELASASSFLAWGRDNGAVLDPAGFVGEKVGGGEHSVVFDEVNGRVFKLTKPGLFGAQAEDAGAYLERMALSNRVFGDDVKFEGIVNLPGEHESRAVTSQPFVKGRDATPEEQVDYLRGKGFIEHDGRWVHRILGVSVWDTQTPGNVITKPDGTMQAVDLQVEPATSQELRAVQEKSGIGGDPAFSRTNVAQSNDLLSTTKETVSRVERLLDDLQSSWGSKLKTQVHASVNEISDPKLRAGALEAGNVEAFFDPSDGSIHIIADRVGGLADAERLLRHEGIHWAFAGPLRGEYLGLLDDIRRLVPEDRWKELSERYAGHSDAAIVEEYLAYEGQNNPTSTAWRSFVYEAKRLLRKVFGDKVEFTDADIAALLHKANRKLERGTSGEALGAPLADQEVSYSKKGQGRTSLEDVKVGDDFNAVKKLFPKKADAPNLLAYRGTLKAMYQSIAADLLARPVVTDPDGKTVLIANPDGHGDKNLQTRAEHLAASKPDRYKMGSRVFDGNKAEWIPNIWKTIEDYSAKIKHYNDIGYVRRYANGTFHIVFVEYGKVVNQVSYDAAAVSQRALDATAGLKGATILKVR